MPLHAAPTIVVRPVAATVRPEDLAVLDAEEHARARTLRSPSMRAQFVTRRALLRREVGARLDLPAEQVAFWCEPCFGCGGPHGRPRARGLAEWFSVSSTLKTVALAFADRPVGIDVEALVSRETALDVTPTLHPHEHAAVTAEFERAERAGRETFTRIWTRKEALLKATGEGLTPPLERDDVSNPANPPEGWHVADLAEGLARDEEPTFGAWAMRSA